MAAPNPAPRKKTPRTSAPATGFHLTHADNASPIRANTTASASPPKKSARASQRLSQTHEPPERPASTRNKMSPGTQVINDTSHAMTQNFPNTYSLRENGRQKYRGRALL